MQGGIVVRALAACAVLAVVAIALRVGLGVDDLSARWDEPFMLPAVHGILTGGWTAEHLLDYEDTKGPVFFWTYAAIAELTGGDLPALRTTTLVFFALAGLPLGLLAWWSGLCPWRTMVAALLLALTPYLIVLGQLFMSEPSFVFGALMLIVVVAWGLGAGRHTHPVAGPVLFGVLLAVLLHHRPHVVAFAGAACLVAFERDRFRSWGWWLAAALAGAARLPFYARWDGLVSPAYQHKVGLGLRAESVAYLLIALLPVTAVLLWPALRDASVRTRRWWWIAAGAIVGIGLGAVGAPDLVDDTDGKFRGLVATTLKSIPALASGSTYRIAFALLAGLGGAALAALGAVTAEGDVREPAALVRRLAGWIVVLGWALYGLTRGDVYDRYLAVFAVLLPLVWVARLPRWLMALQMLGLGVIAAGLVTRWLT